MTMGSGNAGWRGVGGSRAWIRALGMISVWLVFLGSALPGTISVTWSPAGAPDVVGYRVYYGATPGDHSNVQSVAAPATATDLTGAADCTLEYVVVRAYDGRLEGPADSNAVRGFPRPIVTGVAPTSIQQGETKSFTVTGVNFDAGVAGDATRPGARIRLSSTGLVATNAVVVGCNQMTVTIQAGAGTPTGFATLGVENPDLSYTDPLAHPWVFGVLNNAIEIKAADTTAPTVQTVTPAAGATNVAAAVLPTVTFSEPVDPTTVTSRSVTLLDANGVVTPQAAGWPTTAGAVVTLQPAQPLAAGQTYRISVMGDVYGVKDLAGHPLAADWVQQPGFTVDSAGRTQTNTLSVLASNPAAGQKDVPRDQREIRIGLNRDLSILWRKLSSSELRQMFRVTRLGVPLQQTAGSPTTADSGQTVVITLLRRLTPGALYSTEIQPAGTRALAALNGAGVPAGVLLSGWRTDPPWTAASSLLAAAYRSGPSGTPRQLTIPVASGATPPENTNVPWTPQFVVTFRDPVTGASLDSSMFRLQRLDGRDVAFAGRPQLEAGGANVVLTLAASLDPGRTYKLTVNPGDGAAAVVIPFTTAVSAGAQNGSLAVAP